MKLLKLSFLLLLLLSWGACNNDDDSSSCAQSDWVGTYTGTTDCITTSTETVTVTITAVGSDNITVSYETASGDSEFGPISINGCEGRLDFTDPTTGDGFMVEAELNGNDISYTETITVLGNSETCTFNASK
ncbi:MAG: hypothetical protein AAGG75_08725 [Bacteroidota bacterium]